MGATCALSFLCSQIIFSAVSVVFDFNASLNDIAPISPMLLSVCFYENEKEWIIDGCHLCAVSFCVYNSDRVS